MARHNTKTVSFQSETETLTRIEILNLGHGTITLAKEMWRQKQNKYQPDIHTQPTRTKIYIRNAISTFNSGRLIIQSFNFTWLLQDYKCRLILDHTIQK